jgi:uncharacterized protein
MRLSFDWDARNAAENYYRHGVSFEEAITVFYDPFSIPIDNPDHSTDERRYIDTGTSENGRVLVVSYTERGRNIRIISCREATRRERRQYEEVVDEDNPGRWRQYAG